MRWFKHMTDSADDEKLAALLAKHGPEGYGLWWMIVELVAKQIPKDGTEPEVTYPVSIWLRFTCLYHHKKFRILVQSLHDLRLISAQSPANLCTISALSTKDLLTISIPNILKFRNEYSKKSGQTPESVRSKMEKQKQRQIQKEESSSSDEIALAAEPTMTRKTFSHLYQQTFGKMMPGMLNCECQDICKKYPPYLIREAFRIGAERGAGTFSYIKAVLEGEGKPLAAARSQPTFQQQKAQNTLNAAREFAGGDL